MRLRDEVDAFPSITWGTLYKEGLFNPLFAVRIHHQYRGLHVITIVSTQP